MSKKFKSIKINGHAVSHKENTMTIEKNNRQVAYHLPKGVTYNIQGDAIVFTSDNPAMQGTAESLCFNAISGLDKFHERRVKVVGVGYKMALNGKTLTFALGFSHLIDIVTPDNIDVTLVNPTNITLKSPDLSLLGNFVAKLLKLKYNVYKGTGVLDTDLDAKGLLRRKEVKRK